jgi:hypothetical protein
MGADVQVNSKTNGFGATMAAMAHFGAVVGMLAFFEFLVRLCLFALRSALALSLFPLHPPSPLLSTPTSLPYSYPRSLLPALLAKPPPPSFTHTPTRQSLHCTAEGGASLNVY